MKQLHFILLCILFLLVGCNSSKKTDASIDQVGISLEQNGMIIMPSNGIYRLDKRAFNIVLDFPQPKAVLVNTTFFNDIAAEGKPLAGREEFQEGNTMAVSLFNEEQTIYMSEEASSPWFYESEQDHNFSKVKIDKERYQCTRTIKYFQGGDFEKVGIEHIDDPIFLTFVPSTIHEINPDSVDVLGKYLKIEWNDTPSALAANTALNEQAAVEDVKAAHAMEEPAMEAAVIAENAMVEAADIAREDKHQFSPLVNRVIEQLELDSWAVNAEFVCLQVNPANPKESIVFIPVTVEDDEDFFRLSTYVVIADNETEVVLYTFFEPYSIQSDAIMIEKISIDTADYYVEEEKRAFGIRVSHRSMSQPNPYNITVLSLYAKEGNELAKILDDYTISEFGGEGDAYYSGEFVGHDKTLTMSSNKTNQYFDILVKDEITYTMTFEGTDGECDATEKISYEESVLKYNVGAYKEIVDFMPLTVFLYSTLEDDSKLRDSPDGEAIFDLDKVSECMMVVTETKNGWSKVVEVHDIYEGPLDIPSGSGWVKNNYLAATTRKKIALLDAPEHGTVKGTVDVETRVQVLERSKDWVLVLVEEKEISGWIESEWLCGNPVTTCP